MKRSGITVVFCVQIHVLRLEVVQTDGLITLSRNVKHIKSVHILSMHVGSVVHQHLDDLYVTLKGTVMQCSKLIFRGLEVDPLSYIVLIELLLGQLQQYI